MTAADAITIIFDDVLAVDVSESYPSVAAKPHNASYPSKYNNTITFLDLAPLLSQNSDIFKAFDGSTVQLYGIAPPAQIDQAWMMGSFTADAANRTIQIGQFHAPGYGGLQYTSPPNTILSTLVLAQAAGFALDYAVVTVFPTTDLLGTTILVDDSSSSLIWHGSWSEENNFTLPVKCFIPPFTATLDGALFSAHIAPHANTTHASQTVGDEFEFWFTGTSIVVYGITPSNPDPSSPSWLLQMSFMLDGAEPIMVNFTSRDPDSEFRYEQPHFVYFNASNIPAGNHSLVGGVVDVVGSTLPRARIDYITYKPSFVSQAEMPVLPPFASTPTITSSTSKTPSMSPTSSSVAGSGGSDKAKIRINKAAVAGGAVGAVVLCGLAILLVVYMRRRQKRKQTLYQVDELFSGSSASASPTYILPVGEKRGAMWLGNDNATQEPRTVFQEPVHAGPPAAEHLSQPLVDTPAVHRDGLEQLPVGPPQGNTEMDSRFRELQDRMEQLTQEVREQILPPAYEGDAT